MQASTALATSLNPFAAQTTGQGTSEGVSGAPAGLVEGLIGQDGEGSADGGFGSALTEALAAASCMILPAQPIAAATLKVDPAAVQAEVLASTGATLLPADTVALTVDADQAAAAPNEAAGDPKSNFPAASMDDLAPTAPSLSSHVREAVRPQLDAPTTQKAAPADQASVPSAPRNADIAAAAVLQAQTSQGEAKGPQAPQIPVQAQTAAATAPGLVKPAAEAAKPAGKDKTAAAAADEVRPAAGGSNASATHPTAKSIQEAVTELAVTPPEALDAESAAPPESAPEAPAIQTAAATTEVRGQGAGLGEAARATPQTVAHLAAQIAQKLDGRTTRFDVQLDPHGLGRVDVRVEIGPRGDISAALSFDNPQAAAELRGRAGELQAALEQAGFDLSKTSLSFNSGGQGNQGLWDQQKEHAQGRTWQARAFADLSDTPETAPTPARQRAKSGVDVRI